MEHKALGSVEMKDADQGLASAAFCRFDVIDHDSDVVQKTAFKDGQTVRISAYNHGSWSEGQLPVGKGVVRVAGGEAVCDMQFFLNTPQGKATWDTMKAMGDLQEFSFGFDVTDSEPGTHEGKSVRFIKGVDVFEVSPVLRGAGIGTRTLSMKGEHGPEPEWRVGEFEWKRTFTQAERDAAVRAGHAMPDGSYPIENVDDLRNAIHAVGRGSGSHDAIRAHIIRQAKRLHAMDQIPDDWKGDGSMAGKSSDEEAPRPFVRAVTRAMPVHETQVAALQWDGVKTTKALSDDARPSELRSVYAWVDPDGDPEVKSSYRMPHHHGVGGPANVRACLVGIAQLNGAKSGIPDEDRQAVYEHLSAHLRDADREPPELRTAGAEGKSNQRFGDEASDVMARLSSLIDRATEVMVLRSAKGRGMSPATADLLSWVSDELVRLKSLLDVPIEEDKPQVSDDEIAATVMAALARINEL